MPNPKFSLRPGQRVGASLPLRGDEEELTVSREAIILDYFGGTWVYEKTAEHTYVRRRVIVDRVAGPVAVLASGPKKETVVVTKGAAEMAGTDFGFSK